MNRSRRRMLWAFTTFACIAMFSAAAFGQPGEKLSPAAKAAFEKGDFTACVSEYSSLISKEPDNAKYLTERSRCRLMSATPSKGSRNETELDAALKDAESAIAADPKASGALIVRGVIRSFRKDENGAVLDFGQAIEIDPSSAKAYFNRAVSKRRLRDRSGAIADLTKVIELQPKMAAAYTERGSLFFETRKYSDAVADLSRSMELGPATEPLLYSRARAYIELSKWTEALSDLTRVIKLDPRFEAGFLYRGLAYENLKRWNDAVADYTKLIALSPAAAQGYLGRGRALSELGKANEAVADLKKAVSIDPENKDALARLEKLEPKSTIAGRSNASVANDDEEDEIDKVAREEGLTQTAGTAKPPGAATGAGTSKLKEEWSADLSAFNAETKDLWAEIGSRMARIKAATQTLIDGINSGNSAFDSKRETIRTADTIQALVDEVWTKSAHIRTLSDNFLAKWEKGRGVTEPKTFASVKRHGEKAVETFSNMQRLAEIWRTKKAEAQR